MHITEIPTEPAAFNQAVQNEAYAIASKKGRGLHPDGMDIKAAEPIARLNLMAQRNGSVFDRIAGFVKRRADEGQAVQAKTQSDIQALMTLQRQYEDMIRERGNWERKVTRADQQFALLDVEVSELKTRLPLYYMGEAGGSSELALSAIVSTYTRFAAIDRAKADWPLVRESIQAGLSDVEKKIAAFEKQNAELFR
jgi:hypothetical protein